MKAKLAFISAHGSTYSIRLLCAVLGVARSWFHDWQAGDQARAVDRRPSLGHERNTHTILIHLANSL
jgi:hypothetical protein